MHHIIFGLMENERRAREVIHELRERGLSEDHVGAVVHKSVVELEELPFPETDMKKGLLRGSLMGALAGTLTISLIAGPLGLLAIGPLAVTMFGAAGGAMLGALGGGLFGAGFPNKALEDWVPELEKGRVIVTVKTDEKLLEREVEDAFERHGALKLTKEKL